MHWLTYFWSSIATLATYDFMICLSCQSFNGNKFSSIKPGTASMRLQERVLEEFKWKI